MVLITVVRHCHQKHLNDFQVYLNSVYTHSIDFSNIFIADVASSPSSSQVNSPQTAANMKAGINSPVSPNAQQNKVQAPTGNSTPRPPSVANADLPSGTIQVKPTASFVIKTRRSDDQTKVRCSFTSISSPYLYSYSTLSQSVTLKVLPLRSHSAHYILLTESFSTQVVILVRVQVFVNFTSHAAVPFNPDDAAADKEVYKIVGNLRGGMDKSGEGSCVFDVIVSPKEIQLVDVDGTGLNRTRVRCIMFHPTAHMRYLQYISFVDVISMMFYLSSRARLVHIEVVPSSLSCCTTLTRPPASDPVLAANQCPVGDTHRYRIQGTPGGGELQAV